MNNYEYILKILYETNLSLGLELLKKDLTKYQKDGIIETTRLIGKIEDNIKRLIKNNEKEIKTRRIY